VYPFAGGFHLMFLALYVRVQTVIHPYQFLRMLPTIPGGAYVVSCLLCYLETYLYSQSYSNAFGLSGVLSYQVVRPVPC
jgi:hypothetical protein